MISVVSQYKHKIAVDINFLAKEIYRIVRGNKIPCIVKYRVKKEDTLLKKMRINKVSSVFKMWDVYGIRIIVKDVEDVFKALDFLRKSYNCQIKNDFITNPKTRPDIPHLRGLSFRCVQLIVHKNGCMFEIQITTSEFNRRNKPLHAEYHQEKYGNL